MSLLPSQNNYAPGTTTPSSSGAFNPLNMVTSARGMLDTLTNKFILRPPNAMGIGGFVFDYEGETQLVVQAEITDHYSEQNTFVNDQAAQKPQRFTMRGYVGELVDNTDVGVLGALNVLQSKLTQLQGSLGKYTPSVLQKIQAATTTATTVVNKVDNAISRAQNIVGLVLPGGSAPTRQQTAYRQLYTLWANNTVFTLNCPFGYFRSVMIEHMMFIQPEETKDWSELSVTVKEMRFINTKPTTPGLSAQLASQTADGRAAYQQQAQTNQGNVQGTTADTSSLFSSFGHVKQAPIGGA